MTVISSIISSPYYNCDVVYLILDTYTHNAFNTDYLNNDKNYADYIIPVNLS
jgi:hypothetical protein